MNDGICLGTRLVVLTAPTSDDGGAIQARAPEGLLAVYAKPQSSSSTADDWPCLQIEIVTNHAVYRGEMDVSQIRLPDDQKQKASQYLLRDGREHPDISVRFQHLKDDNQGLELTILHNLVNLGGAKKKAYTGVLQSSSGVGSSRSHTDKNSKPSILQFCHKLGTAINDARNKIQALENNLQSKEQAMNHWKETAQQLDKEVWQAEKDQLVNSWLKLWKERQTRAAKQLQDLRDELEMTKNALADAGKRRGRASKLDEEIANAVADDLAAHPEPILPMDEIKALAERRKLPSAANASRSILKPGDVVSAASLKKQAEEYQKKKRQAKAAKQAASREKDDSDSDDGQGGNLDQKEPVKQHSRGAGKRQRAAEDSDSSTDDEPAGKAPPAKKLTKPTKTAVMPKRKIDRASSKATSNDGEGDDSPVLQPHSDDEDIRNQIRASTQVQGNVSKKTEDKSTWSTSLLDSDSDSD